MLRTQMGSISSVLCVVAATPMHGWVHSRSTTSMVISFLDDLLGIL